jgi:hypothetical protein
MGLKSELKQYIKKYSDLKNIRDSKIKEIEKSEMYSDEYRKQLIEKEQENFANLKKEISISASSLIDASKQKLLDKKKPIAKDLSFELRLNNALKTIELAGKDMSKDELKQIVEPFKDDYGTTKSLFHIFRSQNIDIEGVLPVDDIDQKVNAIDNFGYGVINAMDYDNGLQVSIAASMMPEDIE